MSEMVFNNGSVPVAVAAKVYKKDPCWVRAGLIAGWLPIGFATRDVDLDVAAAKAELQGTNTAANFGENYVMAEAMINTVLYAREKYKGTVIDADPDNQIVNNIAGMPTSRFNRYYTKDNLNHYVFEIFF